ncbi:MAG: hypothetical protein Q8M02_12670 [Candidatus Didemnitutus sp.]|nr:hypothetical protein [Candidatus Didemnitutus sp.]
MLNLASYRYRRAAASHGGPIERIDLNEFLMLGRRLFQANAFLRPELVAWQTGGEVFSNAAGSGTDASPMVARFKAVSEAIERWAHMSILTRGDDSRYGFDVDPSTNGMAAFPGWRARQARTSALLEAAERFNLLGWWEGLIPVHECASPYPGVDAVIFCSAAPGISVLLYQLSADGTASYGHAAGATFAEACASAAAEMERHRIAVELCQFAHVGTSPELSPSSHPIERRSLYFSTPAGHQLFLERLRRKVTKAPAKPRVVFDGEIRGPWSNYAHVWRVCYAPPSNRFLGGDSNYFFW